MNRQIASLGKDRAVLHIDQRQPKRREKRARERTSISVLEITKFRQTLDRKFDVLNKVHPGRVVRAVFPKEFYTGQRPGMSTTGVRTREMARKLPFPTSLCKISREKEREKQRKAATVLLN